MVTSSVPATEDELIDRALALTKHVYPAVAELVKSYNNQLTLSHARRKKITKLLPIGTQVMRRDVNKTRKSSPTYVGPYTVSSVSEAGSYTLVDVTGEEFPSKIPIEFLKPIRFPLEIIGDSLEIERIRDHKDEDGVRLYLVSWKGMDASENEWLPASNFDTLGIIDEYHRQVAPDSAGSAARRSSRRSTPKRRTDV